MPGQILPQINFSPKFISIGAYGFPWYIALFKKVSKLIAQNRNIYLPLDLTITLVSWLSSIAMRTWLKTPNQFLENVPSTSLHSVCSLANPI